MGLDWIVFEQDEDEDGEEDGKVQPPPSKHVVYNRIPASTRALISVYVGSNDMPTILLRGWRDTLQKYLAANGDYPLLALTEHWVVPRWASLYTLYVQTLVMSPKHRVRYSDPWPAPKYQRR